MAHIVIVEDNPTLLENITFELEMQGYVVTQASSGKHAIEVLETLETKPDLIVSDIAMPEMDGYAFLEAVRKNEKWRVLPFIFLTAFDTSNAIRLGKQLGVDDYLVKPFEPDDLILAIENKLQRHRDIHQEAERSLDGKRRELINMIAHELRTPMTSIYGGIEMLEYSLRDISDDTTHQLFDLVNAGTQRLHRLINRVVLMVQIESGHLQRLVETKSDATQINNILLEALSDFDFQARNVTVQVQLDDEKHTIMGVHEYLKTCFYELVDNAIKFSPPDSTIFIESKYMEDNVRIIVEDSGIGISAKDLDRIWGNFTQINREKYEQQGLGLGLGIVRAIISEHNGECKITSSVKQGTKVTITLPTKSL